MTREEFEHVLRAAADVVNDELVVVGSQAVLALPGDLPDVMVRSHEVDLYPRNAPERADEIDGVLGDGSRFHETYDYYAHGVGPETVVAPAGWQGRLIKLTIAPFRKRDGSVVAWCLSLLDLVLAKLAAGREHDIEFAEAALEHDLVQRDQLLIGIDLMPETHRDRVRERVEGLIQRVDQRQARLAGGTGS